MTKYLQKSFSEYVGGNQQYRDNYDAIDWGAKKFSYAEIDSAGLTFPSDIQGQVRQFHEVYGQPIAGAPTQITDERIRLRLNLIAEEFIELLEACSASGPFLTEQMLDRVRRDIRDYLIVAKFDVDLIDTADALADLAYVIEGMNLELGIDSKAVLAEVHRSNMSKLGEDGKPIYREDKKVVKGPNYSKPDIAKVLGL